MAQFLSYFDGFLLCVLFLLPLLWLQRGLHREIQSIFLLVTRRMDISYTIFALLFLPGVFLHEASHYLVARLLGVRTGRFSLLPKPLENGRLQLGSVETSSSDFIRDSLIGAAPLLTGGVFVIYAGINHLGLQDLWSSLAGENLSGLFEKISSMVAAPDFWVWFYLTFIISSTMLPSASDRKAWRPLLLIGIIILGIILLAGAGSWFLEHLSPYVNTALRTVAIVFAISTVLHFVLILPIWMIRVGLSRLLGLKVL